MFDLVYIVFKQNRLAYPMVLGRFKEIWRRRRRFPAAGHEKAGFAAEAQVGHLIEAGIADTCWRVFHGPRIPAPKEKRCREVDFVVIGPDEVWMVECKHWSGRMEIVDGEVIQHRRNDHGQLNHKDTFGIIAHKGDVLREYHEGEMPTRITSFVVFSNQNLEIPGEVMAREDCFRQSDLLEILPSETKKVQPSELSKESTSLVKTLETVGSWDLVNLHGGREYNGDLLSVSEDSGVLHAVFNSRNYYDAIKIETERSWLKGLFNPSCEAIMIKDGKEVKRCSVNPSANLQIRRAARSQPTTVEWRHVTRIDLMSNPEHHNMRK